MDSPLYKTIRDICETNDVVVIDKLLEDIIETLIKLPGCGLTANCNFFDYQLENSEKLKLQLEPTIEWITGVTTNMTNACTEDDSTFNKKQATLFTYLLRFKLKRDHPKLPYGLFDTIWLIFHMYLDEPTVEKISDRVHASAN